MIKNTLLEDKKNIRSIVSNTKLSILQKIYRIKECVNPNSYKEAIKSHPLFYKFINKDSFFPNLEDIKIKEPFSFTRDFKKEFKWSILNIEMHLDRINLFLKAKSNFEEEIFLGRFEQANKTIQQIEAEFGMSLWLIESTLLLNDLDKGSEANWELLTTYLRKIQNSYYEFNINSSSKRAERNGTYDSFLNQFQHDINNVFATGYVKDYFVFQNFTFANYDYDLKNLEGVLYVSGIFSVLDQYLTLINIIIYHISTNSDLIHIALPFIKKSKEIIKNDIRLINIFNVLSSKENENAILNTEIIECFDYYYSGNFTESLKLSIKLLLKYPLEFELYQLYCKSLINLKQNFISIGISEIGDSILEDVFKLLSFSENSEESFSRLMKSTLVFMNFNIGKQIFGLLLEVGGTSRREFYTAILSTSFLSPNIMYLINGSHHLRNKLNGTYSFRIYNIKSAKLEFGNLQTLSNIQEAFIKAEYYFGIQKYEDVIQIISHIDEDILYYKEKKYTYLFYSYTNLNLLADALNIFGIIYFDDRIIYRKVEYNELYIKIEESIDKDIFFKNYITCSILYSLVAKGYDLYVVYDDFIYNLNIDTIRNLDIGYCIEKYGHKHVIHFLFKVATIETLKYNTDYRSISEVEEDRIFILNKLIEINPSTTDLYQNELDEIYRSSSVRKVLREVDEGRLFVDINKLKEDQIKKLNYDFSRFKEIESIASGQALIGFNPSNTKDWEKALVEKNHKAETYNSADYLAFKNIYLESRENFLFSKEYGLDSCLSTRIRHGALKNHIRSVFEKLDLITSKVNDIYKDNYIWESELMMFIDKNHFVQTELKLFSKSIDDYNLFIVDNMIQIQTEKNRDVTEGLFEYYTSDEILYSFYIAHKELLISVDSTIDIILTTLINYTIFNIQDRIHNSFRISIPTYFQKLIDSLIDKLLPLNLPPECRLIQNLNKSKTEIQNELEYLSEWFSLNTTSSSSLLDIKTIIEASLNLTNRINPLYELLPNIDIKLELAGYSSLIFVFNILFKNVIEHSKLPAAEICLKIEMGFDSPKNCAYVKVVNNINPKVDYTANLSKLESIKANWNNHQNIERSNKEGQSGFDKIKRILLYEAIAKTEYFDYTLLDNQMSIILFFPYNEFPK